MRALARTRFREGANAAAMTAPGAAPTMAAAMYAPVCTRFLTYDVKLDKTCADYRDRIMALPDMVEWIEAARNEPDEMPELDAEF